MFDIKKTRTGKRCKNCNRKLLYSDKYDDFCDDKCKEILNLKLQLKKKEQESIFQTCKVCGSTINFPSDGFCSSECFEVYQFKLKKGGS